MRHTKKLASLTCALALCAGMAVPAFAVTTETIDGVSITNVVRKETKTVLFYGYEGVEEKTITIYYIADGAVISTGDGLSGVSGYILTEDGVYEANDGGQMGSSWTETQEYAWCDLCEIITSSTDQQVFYAFDDGSASTTPEQPTTASGFTDVADDAWYAKQVKWAVDNGITSGTGDNTFSPDRTCSTAEILTFLWRAAGSVEPTIANPFTDVTEADYFYKPAVWAYENGLVSGTALNGAELCTRAATVTYLWKLAGAPAAQAPAFVDVAADADYAQAVQWAVENGVTGGISATEFGPAVTCTRGQIVTFLYADFAR